MSKNTLWVDKDQLNKVLNLPEGIDLKIPVFNGMVAFQIEIDDSTIELTNTEKQIGIEYGQLTRFNK